MYEVFPGVGVNAIIPMHYSAQSHIHFHCSDANVDMLFLKHKLGQSSSN